MPKRRSTGVVQLEKDEIDIKSDESADEVSETVTSMRANASASSNQELKKSNLKAQNGDVDYKKLWEESQCENARLRVDMTNIRTDLDSTRQQLKAQNGDVDYKKLW